MKQQSPMDPVPASSAFKMEAAASTSAPKIDTKNLDIIKDQMYHEALAYKKCQVYANSLSEQPLKDMATNFAQHHKQHFDALQNYLNSHQ
ncbi:MAG: ferritin-like domain-containing protein [Candidatus Pelethousia sp.]|nr:ferritin-like domain-containing protein [Candidatus Pelethousia sp.]